MLVGDSPAEVRALCCAADIDVLGEVAHLPETLSQAAVGLAPVSEGSGIRVKILEYVAAGLPVVASSTAAEGIRLPAVFVADDVQEQVRLCIELLTHREYFDSAIRNSQAVLANEYLWSEIAARAISTYRLIREAPRRQRANVPDLPCGLPMWIEEVLAKGRFASAYSNQVSWGVAECGVVRATI
jgi:glycosyltransferase involved in cell wall biosynthesis